MEATFKKTKVYKGVKFVIYELVDRVLDQVQYDLEKERKLIGFNYK